MTKILIAVDFSDSCSNAVNYIAELVKDKNIKVSLIHIYSLSIQEYSSYAPLVSHSVIEERKVKMAAMLKDLLHIIPEENRHQVYSSYGVYPSNDIIEAAIKGDYHLVVTAMRQKYSIIDRLIGTVTAAVFSHSPIPVLAIPNGMKYDGIKNILHPTSAAYTETFLTNQNERLSWLTEFSHIVDTDNIHISYIDNGERLDIESVSEEYKLTYFSERADSIQEGIFNVISNMKIDLIAIQKEDRKFWEGLYHSSLTRKILFKSRTPILIF